MPLTLLELCERLQEIDEITLLERLNISSEDLVHRFIDVVEDNFESLAEEFEEDDEDGEL